MTNNNSVDDFKEQRFSNGLFCIKYGCTDHIIRKGKGVHGKQRYFCKNCSKIFTSTTDTFLSSTKKDIEIWKKYIQCMVRRLSIRKSATECNILIRTSFENVFNDKIKEKSIICTDKEKSYLKFSKSNNLEHIRLEEYKSKKGIYHINHINSYHTS